MRPEAHGAEAGVLSNAEESAHAAAGAWVVAVSVVRGQRHDGL